MSALAGLAARYGLLLDGSTLPERRLASRAAIAVVDRTLDVLPPRYRAVMVIDSVDVAPEDVAAGLGEPLVVVRRRRHQVRSALRERLTEHFTADTTPDRNGGPPANRSGGSATPTSRGGQNRCTIGRGSRRR